MKNDNVKFGTLDTWLLYQASNGKMHVTDVSCASATGLFNLFSMSWMPNFMFQYFGITCTILPSVCSSNLSTYLVENNVTCKISNITIACSVSLPNYLYNYLIICYIIISIRHLLMIIFRYYLDC